MSRISNYGLIILTICASHISFPSTAQKKSDPNQLFEEFWQLLDDHYAFFDLRNVDWKTQKEKFAPRITSSMSEDELFQELFDMINPLQDGHTFIIYKGKKYRSGGDKAIWAQARPTLELIRQKYLKAYKERANGAIGYGMINDRIGYVRITAMEGYSPDEIDGVLNALSDAESMVVDVCFNGDGMDQTSLALAGRFADQPCFAYSKDLAFFCNKFRLL